MEESADPETAAVSYAEAMTDGDVERVRSMKSGALQENDLYDTIIEGTADGLTLAGATMGVELVQKAFCDPEPVDTEEKGDKAAVVLSVNGIAQEDDEAMVKTRTMQVINLAAISMRLTRHFS